MASLSAPSMYLGLPASPTILTMTPNTRQRKDWEMAFKMQQEEVQMSEEQKKQMLEQQEKDAKLAKQLQAELNKEAEESTQTQASRDARYAQDLNKNINNLVSAYAKATSN